MLRMMTLGFLAFLVFAAGIPSSQAGAQELDDSLLDKQASPSDRMVLPADEAVSTADSVGPENGNSLVSPVQSGFGETANPIILASSPQAAPGWTVACPTSAASAQCWATANVCCPSSAVKCCVRRDFQPRRCCLFRWRR